MGKTKEQQAETEDTTRDKLEMLYRLLSHEVLGRTYYNPAHANLHMLEEKIRAFLENEVKERLK